MLFPLRHLRRFAPLALLAGLIGLLTGCSRAQVETAPVAIPEGTESLVVAGGCFWCVETDMAKKPGVVDVVSGYSGGDKRDATYRDHEGHREVVLITYDPAKTNYRTLVDSFLRTIDVTDAGGQFCDRGYAYTTAVHFDGAEEESAARAALEAAKAELGQNVVTAVEPRRFFVEAEGYHQDYAEKNPLRYNYYRRSCGRDRRVKALWGASAH